MKAIGNLQYGDARGFLNAIFEVIAELHPQTRGRGLKEGTARAQLQAAGFFKPNPKDPTKSFEGRFVNALADLLGSDGAHTGASDGELAAYRYAATIVTADYFLARAAKI